MADPITPLLTDLADEVRAGGDLNELIAAYADEFGVKADALRVRFNRSFPNGITAPLPTADEMNRRREEEALKKWDRDEAFARSILDFFAANPALKNEVRRNIYRYTGKRSCNLATAKAIADKLANR